LDNFHLFRVIHQSSRVLVKFVTTKVIEGRTPTVNLNVFSYCEQQQET